LESNHGQAASSRDKILIKRLEAESKTKSGIVLPDSAKEKPKRRQDPGRSVTASASTTARRPPSA